MVAPVQDVAFESQLVSRFAERTAERRQVTLAPWFAASVLLGFAVLATRALGLRHDLAGYAWVCGTALVVYGLDAVVDRLRTGRSLPWLSVGNVCVGAAALAWSAPALTRASWCVTALYLPLGLLWTVRWCPVRSVRGWRFIAPRELPLKPLLVSLAFAWCALGVPLGQAYGTGAALGPYAVLLFAFVLCACVANALTMDAADLFEPRVALRATGVVGLGAVRLERWCRGMGLAQLALGFAVALGAPERGAATAAAVVAAYTLLATRAVFTTPSKWLRSLACDAQGLAIAVGLLLALVPARLPALARPFEGSALSEPERWPAWITMSVMAGALAWLVAYGLMVRAGNRDAQPAMPAIALFVNLTWELQHAFVAPEAFPSNIVNVLWLVLDVFLLAQLVRHAPVALERRGLARVLTGPLLALGVLAGYAWQVSFDIELANPSGEYAAFVQNAVMSALFLHWGLTAPHLRGQRASIAIAKGLGSALYIAPVYALTGSTLLLTQGIVTALLDLGYWLVLQQRRHASVVYGSPLGMALKSVTPGS